MKRIGFMSALMAVLAIFVFGGVALAGNQSYKTGSTVTIASSEVVDHTVFAAGNTVTLSGTINGDVFCAGQTVYITGIVNGDVFCAGQTVSISGTVNGSVRAAGQTVSIAGTVQRAISLAGQSVSVEPNAKVGGDAILAGSSILVAGNLARDSYAAGETVTVTGKIARDLEAHTNNLTIAGEASVGDVNQIRPAAEPKQEASTLPMTGLKAAIAFGLAMFVTAMVLVAIAPQRFHGLADQVLVKPGKTFLIGVLTAFLLPVVFVLLLVSVVGIPLALLLGIVWVAAALLSGPVFAYIIGRRLMGTSHKPLAIMAVGSVVVLVLYLVPVVNLFVGSTAYFMGIGALTGVVGGAIGKPKYTV